jgi:hypothetical protein
MAGQKSNPQKCRNGCGTEIFFNDAWKSKNGKAVPVEEDSDGKWKSHDCPNSPYQKGASTGGSPAQRSDNQRTAESSEVIPLRRIEALAEIVRAHEAKITSQEARIAELEARYLNI